MRPPSIEVIERRARSDRATALARLVLDPSFRGTSVEADLRRLADRDAVQLRWNDGFRLAAADTPADFRGPTMPALARATADADGMLDAAAIGRALRGITYEPPTPDGDPEDGARQQYKKLWHCVLRFGSDARPAIGT